SPPSVFALLNSPSIQVSSETGNENSAPRRPFARKQISLAPESKMSRSAWFLGMMLLVGSQTTLFPEEKRPTPVKPLPDGVYAVERDNIQKKAVLPLKKGEALLVHQHRYLQKGAKEPPRFVVVRLPGPVALDLSRAPRAVKEKGEVVRILLTLQPKAA